MRDGSVIFNRRYLRVLCNLVVLEVERSTVSGSASAFQSRTVGHLVAVGPQLLEGRPGSQPVQVTDLMLAISRSLNDVVLSVLQCKDSSPLSLCVQFLQALQLV